MNELVSNAVRERALAARSSLRLFAALALLCALGATGATAAQAAPKPVLLSTNPTSPGASLTPRIKGDADGVITSAVGPRGPRALGPITRTFEPNATVNIYTTESCTGTIAGTGTATELEGAGILLSAPLPPDSETIFFATETDLSGTSQCSNGIVYQQVTTPPAPPVFNAVSPGTGANDNFPHLTGNSAPNSIVFIYADPSCGGSLIASGSAATFAAGGIQAQVGDNSTTTFYALATLAGISSGCSSSSISYQEVTPAEAPPSGGAAPVPTPTDTKPEKPQPPRLRTIPGGIANDTTPLVAGSAPGASTVKIYGSPGCQDSVVAKGSAAQLAAGLAVEIVPNTTVTLYGKSVNGAGESGCSAAPVIYTDDSIAPRTRITAGPGIKTLKPTVVFRFKDITGGFDTQFLCKLDRKPWKACRPPLKLKKLGHKRHTLQVKAFDAAGNHEKKGVKRSFQVVAAP